jgi:hypothetical protein
MSDDEAVAMWVVYHRPTDFPTTYVARRWECRRDGPVASSDIIESDSLESVRAALDHMGLTCLSPDQSDERRLQEVWL